MRFDERLNEYNFGPLNGMTREDIAKYYPQVPAAWKANEFWEALPGEEGDPEGPTDPGLPEAQKTGGQCPRDLVNIIRDLRDGKDLTNPQVKTLQDQSRHTADRKLFIGALVDMLIDFYKEKKRTECEVISKALFKVWGNGCGYDEKTATFDRQTFDENTTDFPVRVWYDYYTRYKA